jgi:glutaredoxin 3
VPTVEIYVKSSCSYCWRVKRLLDGKGVDYREIVIDFGGPDRQAMIQRANGRTTVRLLFIGGRHIGGWDDLMALERAGRLDELIAA